MYILVSNNNDILFADRSASMVSSYIKGKFNRELAKADIDNELLGMEFGSSITYESTQKKTSIKITRIPSVNEISVAYVKANSIMF